MDERLNKTNNKNKIKNNYNKYNNKNKNKIIIFNKAIKPNRE